MDLLTHLSLGAVAWLTRATARTKSRGATFATAAIALAHVVGCSGSCVHPDDYAPEPIRLQLTGPDGEPICTKGVVVTTDVSFAETNGDVEPDPTTLLEVVTYNNLDKRGEPVPDMENLCEHRVHRWHVDADAGTPSVVVLFETEDGQRWTSAVVDLPVVLDACGAATGALIEIELEPR